MPLWMPTPVRDPRRAGRAACDRGSGGIDRRVSSARQLVLEFTSLGAAVSGERCEHADAVECTSGVADGGISGVESLSGGCELVAGVVELALSVGGLVIEDVLVGGDELAQLAVDGPGVVDCGHGGVGDAGERGGDLIVGVEIVGETATEVDGRKAGGVPGVGGLHGAGLGGVAAVGIEGRGTEEVDVVPGATLGTVDGACPGV